eukprot:TRINITY_DN385_c0_g1_i5.p1 TRINITY_DN385_c0_g1~~TRINITY_DN385_c0_g1_i5.p1  ORF type:complete len:619 (+),score=203.01 TRINITY_DN385_c0_g1_i5:1505-3361(+)
MPCSFQFGGGTPLPPQQQSFSQYGGSSSSYGGSSSSYGGSSNSDHNDQKPSPVIHVRNVDASTPEEMLQVMFEPYGQVVFVKILYKGNQALVEMDSIESASRAIEYASMNPLKLSGRDIYISYSRSQTINKKDSPALRPLQLNHNGVPMHQGENTIHVRMLNARVPIDVDTLHMIFNQYGFINRIVIFTKNGEQQALVEFADPASAPSAMLALNGKDIYDGCNTLSLQYSPNQTLNVKANNERTRDFTNPNLPAHASMTDSSSGFPPVGGAMAGAGFGMPQQQGFGAGYNSMGQPSAYNPMGAGGFAGAYGNPGFQGQHMFGGQGMQHSNLPSSPVIILYDLNDQMTTVESLFNIFCLYGNVVRAKLILPKVDDVKQSLRAMVQMENVEQAASVLENLRPLNLFGAEVSMTPSKHPTVSNRPPIPDTHEVLGPILVDYEQTSNMNRFRYNSTTLHNVYPPSPVIHFHNGPADWTQEGVTELLQQKNAPMFTKIKLLGTKEQKDGSMASSGLLQFNSEQEALTAIALCNNVAFDERRLRFSFSKSTNLDENALDDNQNQTNDEQNEDPMEQETTTTTTATTTTTEESTEQPSEETAEETPAAEETQGTEATEGTGEQDE